MEMPSSLQLPLAMFSWIRVAKSAGSRILGFSPTAPKGPPPSSSLMFSIRRSWSMRGPRKSVRPNTRSCTSWLYRKGLVRAFSLVVTSTASWRVVHVTFSPAIWVIKLRAWWAVSLFSSLSVKVVPASLAAASAAGSTTSGRPETRRRVSITFERLSSSAMGGICTVVCLSISRSARSPSSTLVERSSPWRFERRSVISFQALAAGWVMTST